MTRTALICGVSGQDGSLPAQFLPDRGYRVIGTSRDAELSRFDELGRRDIRDRVMTPSMTLTDLPSVLQILPDTQPNEAYNLAGQTTVALSFAQPVETLESIALGMLNLLGALRFVGGTTRLYNAFSSECFGETSADHATEHSPFHPRNPYSVTKSTVLWEVANYREAYGLFASSGVLFNHENPLRPARFAMRKVVGAAVRIANGSRERLKLGALNVVRDWGWAEDHSDAMWRMPQSHQPDDFVIATGRSHSLGHFVQQAFHLPGLDWRAHVDVDAMLRRLIAAEQALD